MDKSFNIIIDTREKKPWSLECPSILQKTYRKLATGDYSVDGYEDIFCIDRKASVAEIALNINQKRFHKELARMQKMPHAYILLEADFDELINFPMKSSLPDRIKKKIRVSGQYILKCIARMNIKYGVHFVFCGNRERAQKYAISIMKEIVNNER